MWSVFCCFFGLIWHVKMYRCFTYGRTCCTCALLGAVLVTFVSCLNALALVAGLKFRLCCVVLTIFLQLHGNSYTLFRALSV